MQALHSTEAEHFLLKMSGKMLSSVNQGAVLKFKWMMSVFKYELQSKKRGFGFLVVLVQEIPNQNSVFVFISLYNCWGIQLKSHTRLNWPVECSQSFLRVCMLISALLKP